MRFESWRNRMPQAAKRLYHRGAEPFRRLSRILTGMEIHQMEGRVFDVRHKRLLAFDGFGLYVMPNDYIGAGMITTRSYERHVTRVVRQTLKPGDVFVDIGANLGYFTMLASSIVESSGKVIAFEPQPHNLQLIYASVLHNQCSNVVVSPYAVSDCAGIRKFVTVGSNGGVVTPDSVTRRCDLLVQSVILDEILHDEPRIDHIKIDVEGHEPAALKGMCELLRRHRPNLILEFHPCALRENNAEAPDKHLTKIFELGYRFSAIPFEGALVSLESPAAVMNYWRAQRCETMHLDLYAAAQRQDPPN